MRRMFHPETNSVKASPHRLKWMLSRGAPADPSDPVRRVLHPETNGVKASPHRLKWMLSRGALAAPSDPWNFDAAPVSPRQNGPLERGEDQEG